MISLTITIDPSSTVTSRTITTSRGSMTVQDQPAMLDLPSGERHAVRLRIGTGASALPPGRYVPAATAIRRHGYEYNLSLWSTDWQPAPK